MGFKVINMYQERKSVQIVHNLTGEKRVVFLIRGHNELPEHFLIESSELIRLPRLKIKDSETRNLTLEQRTGSATVQSSSPEISQEDTEVVDEDFAPIEGSTEESEPEVSPKEVESEDHVKLFGGNKGRKHNKRH